MNLIGSINRLFRARLKKMRGGKSKNIMDQMMEMMEKYANNLEDIVNERTRLLCEEKKKTEDLLHRMLPQTVAENLTRGHGVEPVSYNSVSITNQMDILFGSNAVFARLKYFHF